MSRGQICAWQFLFPNQVGYVSSLDEYIYIYIHTCFYIYIYILGKCRPLLQGFSRILVIFPVPNPAATSEVVHAFLVGVRFQSVSPASKIKRSAWRCEKAQLSKWFLHLRSYLSGEDVSRVVDGNPVKATCIQSKFKHLVI